ncbi:MAG: hypothetical protein KC620_05610 [Myxococcales bacterium]|nr:hypothetical protein [Myxococcales bacterium]
MSLIALPRLYFAGHASWNPSTFNNNDNLPTYDAANVRLNAPYLYEQGVYSPQQFAKWAITTTYDPSADEYLPPAEWNYYGDMIWGFVSPEWPQIEDGKVFDRPAGGTTVTGWTDRTGAWQPLGGAWGAAQVAVNPGPVVQAKMCDINPACFWSTQLFADRLQVGSEAAGVGFNGAISRRMCTRFPNLQNNYNLDQQLIIAGNMIAVWQFCLPREDLQFHGGPDDKVTAALHAALAEPEVAGLMVRFSAFETLYFNGDVFRAVGGTPAERLSGRMKLMADLYAQYADEKAAFDAGKRVDAPPPPINRAYSRAIGWIGTWRHGELQSEPEGRLLIAGAALTGQQPIAVAPKKLPKGTDALPLGPMLVEAAIEGDDVRRLSLDTMVTFPKLQLGGPIANYGAIGVRLVGDDGTTHKIATLPADAYGRDALLRSAGVIDVPLAPGVLSASTWFGGDLQLTLFADARKPQIGLNEQAFTARTDDRGVYVEQPGTGQFARPPSLLDVRVQHRGRAPAPGTQLVVAQYDAGWTRSGGEGGAPMAHLIANPALHPVDLGRGTISVRVVPALSAHAEAQLAVNGIMPGFPNLALLALPPDAAVPTLAESIGGTEVVDVPYTVVRVLPFHDQMAIAFEQWLATGPDSAQVDARIYLEVFETWARLFPVMGFLRNPLVFRSWRGPIMEVTDPAEFERSRYMPVNRCLSAGQRRMLELWDAWLSGGPRTKPRGLQKRV